MLRRPSRPLDSRFGVLSERKEDEALSGQVEEMNSRLAKVQGSQKETTKRVLERMNKATAAQLMLQALGGGLLIVKSGCREDGRLVWRGAGDEEEHGRLELSKEP